MTCEWHDKIFSVSEAEFQSLALEIFHFQYQHNQVYRAYVEALKTDLHSVNAIEKIPFLPISFFKTLEIKTGNFTAEIIFESSATTGTVRSRHHVKDVSIYRKSFISSFEKTMANQRTLASLAYYPLTWKEMHPLWYLW